MKKKKKIKKTIRKSLATHLPARPKAEKELIKKTTIRVIGIGGGGGSIVSEIASRIKKANFVVANTDLQALRVANRRASRFQFGQSLTQGLGTGMNPDLGEVAARNEKERIKELFQDQDLCILVACLGGGTSSGAAPIFAKISKNLGNITYGIFTLPFKFEGEKKMEIAKNSLERLKPKLNALTVIPNERIFQIIDKKVPLKGALSAINKNLAESLGGLIETIYLPGLINIDFADLKTILQGQGRLAFLNTVEVQDSSQGEEVVKKVISNPLYPYSIRGAKGVLFNVAGEKNLSLGEVNKISKSIYELINKEARVIFGIGQQKKLKNKIKITLVATGCGTRGFLVKPKKRKLKKKPVQKKLPSPVPAPPKKTKKRKLRKKISAQRRKKKTKVVKKLKTKPKSKPRTKPKKIKVKVSKEPKKSEASQAKVEAKITSSPPEEKVRKNALQIKKEAEEAEKELIEQEKVWETPAFLRRRKEGGQG